MMHSLSLSGITWFVQYSSRALWHQKRNLHATLSHPDTLMYTYQEQSSSEIRSHEEKGWEVVASGKDGKLESWMRETSMGIEDTSGETRADWRTNWMAVSFSCSDLTPSHDTAGGIDILCTRSRKVSEETIEEIRGILVAKGGELGRLAIFPVLNDGDRDEEMRREAEKRYRKWEKRTGKEAGISEDLRYDDVEEKKDSKCGIQ